MYTAVYTTIVVFFLAIVFLFMSDEWLAKVQASCPETEMECPG